MTAGLLIAFEGLDQSGKQTQAESLRDHLTAQGRVCQLLSFPDYATTIGDEIFKALHGERDYPPDVLQLLYVANRGEKRAQIDAWIADGVVVICDRYIASSIAYGEAHGLDAAWLSEIQRFLPAPHLTILLDIAPGDGGRTEGGRARSIRARPGPARPASARAIAGRPPRPAGCGSKGSAGRPRSPPTSSGRSRHDSGCRHRADIRGASGSKHARARLDRRPGRAHVVHEDDPQPFDVSASHGSRRARAQTRSRTLPCRAAAGRSVCDGVARIRRNASTIGTPSWRASSRAWLKPRARRRLRWSGTGTTMSALARRSAALSRRRAPRPRCQRAAAAVLERVHDRAKRPVVGADGAALRERRWAAPAPRADAGLHAQARARRARDLRIGRRAAG